MADVWHYDGVTALRRHATLVVEGDRFRLVEYDHETGPFAFADLIARDGGGFALKRIPGWRIDFVDAVSADVAARLPGARRYGGPIDRFGLWPSVAGFAVIAALVVFAVLQSPPLLARMVPASVEKRLGDVMAGDFGRRGCDDPAGREALAALVRRIDSGDPTLEVGVVKMPMVNAVTLPGGRIVIFDGLLAAAQSPDEVAGVIGHEVGHVRHHDVMESLLRQLGLSVLLGGMEGHVGGYTNALLATAYSRGAEGKADRFAMSLMREAAVSPIPTARFFQRLGGRSAKAERMFAYVASHPVSADRAARFKASADRAVAYRPALDAGQWQALKAICRGDKPETGFRF